MRSAITLGLGIWMAAATSLPAQTNPPAPGPAKPAATGAAKPAQQQPPAKPAAPPSAKPAPQATKPGTPATRASGKPAGAAATSATAKPATKAAKRAAKRPAKPAAKRTTEKRAGTGALAAAESEMRVARRDPFESLVGHNQGKGAPNLPPGKAGLQVSTLRLDGVVKAPNGMIAVVSNPQSRTYFLREGDHLYDGSVEKISMDGVSFHEEGKDAFGKPVERQVNKRIYSSSGEQQ